MKISLALAGVALLGSMLAACGGSDGGGADSDYCKDVKTASKTFGNLDSGDVGKLDDAFKTFHQLAAESPDTIKSDWKKLDSAVTTVEDGLKDAGIKLSDLSELQAGKVPEGVDVSKLQSLATDLQKLSDAEFDKASKAIEKHAKDECKVDLGASS
jgi:hypothetical protein